MSTYRQNNFFLSQLCETSCLLKNPDVYSTQSKHYPGNVDALQKSHKTAVLSHTLFCGLHSKGYASAGGHMAYHNIESMKASVISEESFILLNWQEGYKFWWNVSVTRWIWENDCSLRTQRPTRCIVDVDIQSTAAAWLLVPFDNFTGISKTQTTKVHLKTRKKRIIFSPLSAPLHHCLLFSNHSALNNPHKMKPSIPQWKV